MWGPKVPCVGGQPGSPHREKGRFLMVDGKEAKPRAAEDGHDDGSSDGGRRLEVFKLLQ